MAVRRPLVLIGGAIAELPTSDTLPGAGASADTFETVSKNLSANDASYGYTGDLLTSITFGGIVKTLTYGPDGLETIVLSGAVPGGIALTKTLVYSSGRLVDSIYS